jgi:hypothetical protein
MTGYGRMKTADLKAAIEAHFASVGMAGTPEAEAATNGDMIDRLRAEAKADETSESRREDILAELARFGAVLYPQGTKEHEEYRAALTTELAKWNGTDVDPFTDAMFPEPGDVEYPATSNVEQEFAAAADADDRDAMAEILNKTVPPVIVRDPNATRYEDIPKWTDERLDTKETELAARLTRRTLLGGDRKLTESRLARIKAEIASRSN